MTSDFISLLLFIFLQFCKSFSASIGFSPRYVSNESKTGLKVAYTGYMLRLTVHVAFWLRRK